MPSVVAWRKEFLVRRGDVVGKDDIAKDSVAANVPAERVCVEWAVATTSIQHVVEQEYERYAFPTVLTLQCHCPCSDCRVTAQQPAKAQRKASSKTSARTVSKLHRAMADRLLPLLKAHLKISSASGSPSSSSSSSSSSWSSSSPTASEHGTGPLVVIYSEYGSPYDCTFAVDGVISVDKVYLDKPRPASKRKHSKLDGVDAKADSEHEVTSDALAARKGVAPCGWVLKVDVSCNGLGTRRRDLPSLKDKAASALTRMSSLKTDPEKLKQIGYRAVTSRYGTSFCATCNQPVLIGQTIVKSLHEEKEESTTGSGTNQKTSAGKDKTKAKAKNTTKKKKKKKRKRTWSHIACVLTPEQMLAAEKQKKPRKRKASSRKASDSSKPSRKARTTNRQAKSGAKTHSTGQRTKRIKTGVSKSNGGSDVGGGRAKRVRRPVRGDTVMLSEDTGGGKRRRSARLKRQATDITTQD